MLMAIYPIISTIWYILFKSTHNPHLPPRSKSFFISILKMKTSPIVVNGELQFQSYHLVLDSTTQVCPTLQDQVSWEIQSFLSQIEKKKSKKTGKKKTPWRVTGDNFKKIVNQLCGLSMEDSPFITYCLLFSNFPSWIIPSDHSSVGYRGIRKF